jgi:DNA-binding XRE family transcriptional regulator
MTPEQCRSARAWLAWSQDDLAKAAHVGLSTVKDFENGKRTPIPSTQTAMRVVLEREGIGFSFAIDGGGVKKACGITYSEPSKGAESLDLPGGFR